MTSLYKTLTRSLNTCTERSYAAYWYWPIPTASSLRIVNPVSDYCDAFHAYSCVRVLVHHSRCRHGNAFMSCTMRQLFGGILLSGRNRNYYYCKTAMRIYWCVHLPSTQDHIGIHLLCWYQHEESIHFPFEAAATGTDCVVGQFLGNFPSTEASSQKTIASHAKPISAHRKFKREFSYVFCFLLCTNRCIYFGMCL